MVKYDFRCERCGIVFEFETSYEEDRKPKCPECRSSKNVRKIILPTSIHYRGSGFTKAVVNQE